jgi:hypothetical protein
VAKATWLVRGAADAELVADLLDPPLRSASHARLIATSATSSEHVLTLVPETPLAPGAQLSIVVRTAADEAYTQALRVSVSPAAGAALTASVPAAEAHGVPLNLQAILLRFDGALGPLDRSAWTLRSELAAVSTRVELFGCEKFGLGAGDCIVITPHDVLVKNTTYVLRANELRDVTSAALPPVQITFVTGGERDEELPRSGQPVCAPDERVIANLGCLLASDDGAVLRTLPSEPVRAELRVSSVAVSALSSHDTCTLFLSGLEPDVTYAGALRLVDLAGNVSESALEIGTRARLTDVIIDEVRSDPLGAEPGQEYVELLNSGAEATSLMGYSITTNLYERGRSITTAIRLSPGERLLVVAPTFDVADQSDGPLPAGVRIARLDGALSLANAGQALVLRDAAGARVDMTPALAAPAGQCSARVLPRQARFDQSSFVVGPCSAGEASQSP